MGEERNTNNIELILGLQGEWIENEAFVSFHIISSSLRLVSTPLVNPDNKWNELIINSFNHFPILNQL